MGLLPELLVEGGREEAGPGLEAPAGVAPAVANTPAPLGAQSGGSCAGWALSAALGSVSSGSGFSIALHMSEGCV